MDLVEDLKKINTIEPDQFQAICDLLNQKSTDDDWVVSLAALERTIGADNVGHLSRFLTFLADNLASARNYDDSVAQLDTLITRITEDDEQAAKAWMRIRESLTTLENYFAAKKEEQIKGRFKRVTKFLITTDIRPVLDIRKSGVHKTLIANILKIDTSDGDSFICELYEDDIDAVAEELELTKRKIALFRAQYVTDD